MKLSDLASLDGTQLSLEVAPTPGGVGAPGVDKSFIYVGSAATPDNSLLIFKPGQAKEVIVLTKKVPKEVDDPCGAPGDKAVEPAHPNENNRPDVNLMASNFTNSWAFEPLITGTGTARTISGTLRYMSDGKAYPGFDIPVDAVIIPRSTEAAVEYLGYYRRNADKGGPELSIDGQPLFLMKARCNDELVGVDILRQHFCLDGYRGNLTDPQSNVAIRNMQILNLLEQLINLNKSAATRPATLPVEVVAGG